MEETDLAADLQQYHMASNADEEEHFVEEEEEQVENEKTIRKQPLQVHLELDHDHGEEANYSNGNKNEEIEEEQLQHIENDVNISLEDEEQSFGGHSELDTPNRSLSSQKAHWTENATFCLITAIKETRSTMLFQDKKRRNHFISAKVENMMRSNGFTFSLVQIKNKWKKLKQRYYKKAVDICRNGSMSREWPFFDAMTEILDDVELNQRAPSGIELDNMDKEFAEEYTEAEEDTSWHQEEPRVSGLSESLAMAVADESTPQSQASTAIRMKTDINNWNFKSVFDVERGSSFQTNAKGPSGNNSGSRMLKIFLVIPNTEIRIPMSFLSTTTMRDVLDQAIAKYNVPKENYLSRRENGEDTYNQKQTLDELGVRDNDKLYVMSRIQFWLQSGKRKIVAQCEETKKVKDFLLDVVQRFNIEFNIFLSWTEDGRCHLQDNTSLKGAGVRKDCTLYVCKEP